MLPRLFITRLHVDVHSFAAQFLSDRDKRDKHPALYATNFCVSLLTDHSLVNSSQFLEHFDAIRALKHLPSILIWQRLCRRFDRQLTLEAAQQKTVADVLNEAREKKWGDAEKWRLAYEGLREAINIFAGRVQDEKQKFELKHLCQVTCLLIPGCPAQLLISFAATASALAA